MNYDDIKNIGIKNLLLNASTSNLEVSLGRFWAKWALDNALIIAERENNNEDLINVLRKAKDNWHKGIAPNWNYLLDFIDY